MTKARGIVPDRTTCNTTVRLDGIGDILLQRSRRARRVCLTIEPFRGVRVAVPHGISFDTAIAVACRKREWIVRHLKRIARIEAEALALQPRMPLNRKVARRVIVDRLNVLAGRHGFRYNRVFVRHQKTRWGSCSCANNINLNIHLIRLPSALMDYTILHELVHTRIKHHGPQFWAALAEVVANPRQLDRELDAYAPMLLL